MTKSKIIEHEHDRSLGAAPEAYQGVYSDKNPCDVVLLIAPKGTAKSVTFNQGVIQQLEKGNLKADAMYIRDQENGHQNGAYADFLNIIEKYDLKGYEAKWSSSGHFFGKDGIEIKLGGFDRGENKITGYQKPLSIVGYDELLKASDADKSDKQKAKRANQQLKAISSLARNLVDGGKIIINANMHYKDPFGMKKIYDNFDVDEIRDIVKKEGYGFRILKFRDGTREAKAFPKGLSYLILDPDINQFLKDGVSVMPYVGEAETQAMTESLPEEAMFKELPFAELYKTIKVRDSYGYETQFMSVGFDPASGKDEIAATFFGFNTKTKRMVIMDSVKRKTRGKKGPEILDTLKSFGDEFDEKFLYYGSEKMDQRAFTFYSDTNQKTEGFRHMSDLIEKESRKLPRDRIIELSEASFLDLVQTAKKSGEGDDTNFINKLEEALINNKIEVIKNESTIEHVLAIKDCRVKGDEDGRLKIISHNDIFSTIRYGMQHFGNTEFPGLVREFGYNDDDHK